MLSDFARPMLRARPMLTKIHDHLPVTFSPSVSVSRRNYGFVVFAVSVFAAVFEVSLRFVRVKVTLVEDFDSVFTAAWNFWSAGLVNVEEVEKLGFTLSFEGTLSFDLFADGSSFDDALEAGPTAESLEVLFAGVVAVSFEFDGGLEATGGAAESLEQTFAGGVGALSFDEGLETAKESLEATFAGGVGV